MYLGSSCKKSKIIIPIEIVGMENHKRALVVVNQPTEQYQQNHQLMKMIHRNGGYQQNHQPMMTRQNGGYLQNHQPMMTRQNSGYQQNHQPMMTHQNGAYQQNHQPMALQKNGGDTGLQMNVMTDEQVEVLRKQIAAYQVITQQLIATHKAMSAQQEIAAGLNMGYSYYDSPVVYYGGGNKITTRHRWTPTSAQLQILESMFEEGKAAPNRQKIKEMTNMLTQHGQISETNVYNWFQNRRARSKRKQSGASVSANAESEVETEAGKPEIDSKDDKMMVPPSN